MSVSHEPRNLRIGDTPYPHLRDDGGCVLANDYIHTEKMAFILRAARAHSDLLAALKALCERHADLVNSGDCGFWNPEDDPAMQMARHAIAKGETA